MSSFRNAVIRQLRTLVLAGMGCIAAMAASAQEALPNDFLPAPAGTNILLGYFSYGTNDRFESVGGPSTDARLESHFGIARYVHFFDVGGYTAGVQAYQVFGGLSGARVGDTRLGSASGAQNLALSAFFWPYANQASATYLLLAGYLYPPTGSYDRHATLNVGDNRWRGDIQIGLNKGVTERLSFDLGVDTTFFGDNTRAYPGDHTLSQDPATRVQLWLNWAWSRKLTTSLGWLGFFGGRQQVDDVFNGQRTGTQRIRAAALYFVTPTLQAALELNHDVSGTGGFRQDFGTTLRIAYFF